MAKFTDFDFTGDGGGPDTDPQPEFQDADPHNDWYAEEDDTANYEEPGAGDTFEGQDPTVFAKEGNPDEPGSQQSDVPPVEAEQQTASVNDPKTLGQSDDPESVEQPGDEQEGDSEDDTADPANIRPQTETPVTYPEQGQDSDELTVKDPTEVIPSYYNPSKYETVVDPGPGLEQRRLIEAVAEPIVPELPTVTVIEDLRSDWEVLNRVEKFFDNLNEYGSIAALVQNEFTFIDLNGIFDNAVDEWQDQFGDTVDSTMTLTEPMDSESEFMETGFPGEIDDNTYLDMQDFVDIVLDTSNVTPSNAPVQSAFNSIGQPLITMDSVVAIANEFNIGITDDL